MTKIVRTTFATGLSSVFGGVGMIFANFDAASFGVVLAGVGTLITAGVGAYMTISNGRSKNRQEEMRLATELKLLELKTQMESQARMSQQNNTALLGLQKAVTENTVETVKGTAAAAAAADQAKQRVEQLADRIPVRQSETEGEPAE